MPRHIFEFSKHIISHTVLSWLSKSAKSVAFGQNCCKRSTYSPVFVLAWIKLASRWCTAMKKYKSRKGKDLLATGFYLFRLLLAFSSLSGTRFLAFSANRSNRNSQGATQPFPLLHWNGDCWWLLHSIQRCLVNLIKAYEASGLAQTMSSVVCTQLFKHLPASRVWNGNICTSPALLRLLKFMPLDT